MGAVIALQLNLAIRVRGAHPNTMPEGAVADGAVTAGQLKMANRVSGAHPDTVPEGAAAEGAAADGAAADGAVLPVAAQQTTRAASTRVSNHPIPRWDPSWAISRTQNIDWEPLHPECLYPAPETKRGGKRQCDSY